MRASVRHFLEYQFPAIIWAIVIFVASSIPERKLPHFIRHIDDKFLHSAIFFIFGLLVFRALDLRSRSARFPWGRVLLSILAVIVYGASDEVHQIFVPGRTPDFRDAFADTIGGIVAALVILIFQWRTSQKRAGAL